MELIILLFEKYTTKCFINHKHAEKLFDMQFMLNEMHAKCSFCAFCFMFDCTLYVDAWLPHSFYTYILNDWALRIFNRKLNRKIFEIFAHWSFGFRVLLIIYWNVFQCLWTSLPVQLNMKILSNFPENLNSWGLTKIFCNFLLGVVSEPACKSQKDPEEATKRRHQTQRYWIARRLRKRE